MQEINTSKVMDHYKKNMDGFMAADTHTPESLYSTTSLHMKTLESLLEIIEESFSKIPRMESGF